MQSAEGADAIGGPFGASDATGLNHLTVLPKSFGELCSLTFLDLAFNGLSNGYETSGRFEEAREASARGTRLLPTCEYAYYNLGRLLRGGERLREAQVAFRHASALKPTQALETTRAEVAVKLDIAASRATAAKERSRTHFADTGPRVDCGPRRKKVGA